MINTPTLNNNRERNQFYSLVCIVSRLQGYSHIYCASKRIPLKTIHFNKDSDLNRN